MSMRWRCAGSTSTAFRWWTMPPRPRSRPTMQACGCSGLARRCESAWSVGAAHAHRGVVSTARAASPAAPAATTATPERHQSCEAALTESRRARRRGDYPTAWTQLERAHVLGQPFLGPHLRTHWEMLRLAIVTFCPQEAAGQVLRFVLVFPGTWLGRLP